MKTMFYTNGQQRAEIVKLVRHDGSTFFRIAMKVGDELRYIVAPTFWKAESFLADLGYKGEKDAEYKGIAIRWRERGIHNTMDAIYPDGYYTFLPPFPGTIFYDAATIEDAMAEIDRLENLSNC